MSFTVHYTLHSGIQGEFMLPIEQLDSLVEHFRDRKIFTCQDGSEVNIINPDIVFRLRISGVPVESVEDYIIEEEEEIEPVWEERHEEEREPPIRYDESPTTIQSALFHVVCRCGTEYVTSAYYRINKLKCTACSASVFADRSLGQQATEHGDVWLATNRYFVSKEKQTAIFDYTEEEFS